MSLLVILMLALVLAVAGRLARFGVRIALLIALIALVVNYGSDVARRHGRPSPSTPAIQRPKPR